MDGIGLAMGMVTIPMALLTLGGIAGGVWLLFAGSHLLVLVGIAATLLGLGLAPVIERIVAIVDELAVMVRRSSGSLAGHLVGFVCSAIPMAAILAWEFGSFRIFFADAASGPAVARWLWSYVVALLPWTLYAVRADSDRRTLCGIRAYAGHLGYWLLSLLWIAGVPAGVAGLAMLLPAVLPLTVGTLLAVADREALRNVRI